MFDYGNTDNITFYHYPHITDDYYHICFRSMNKQHSYLFRQTDRNTYRSAPKCTLGIFLMKIS